MYTEEVNKIALNTNDDKRLQTFDRVTIYGPNVFKVCGSEMMAVKKIYQSLEHFLLCVNNMDKYCNDKSG